MKIYDKIIELFKSYAKEVLRTEKLHNMITPVLVEIYNEVGSEGEVHSYTDIPKAIRDIMSRRRVFWSGDSSSLTNITSNGAILKLGSGYDYELVHITKYRKPIQGNGPGYYGAEGTILLNLAENYYIYGNDTFWEIENQWYYQNPQFNSGIPVKLSGNPSSTERVKFNEFNRILYRFKERGELEISFYPDDSFKNNLKWIAFKKR